MIEKIQKFIVNLTGLKEPNIEKLNKAVTIRCRELKINTYEEYYLYITMHPRGYEETKELLKHLLVGETYFFREEHAFRALRDKILPELIKINKETKSLNILSAGCASGEEVYSVGLILRKYFPDVYNNWHVYLLGIDINDEMLERARRAKFTKYSIRKDGESFAKELLDNDVVKWYNEHFEIKDLRLREIVEFKHFNIINEEYPVPPHGKWDIVFCRNVSIYFEEQQIENMLKKFYSVIRESGYLIMGTCDLLGAISNPFVPVRICNANIYRKENRRKEKKHPKVEEPKRVKSLTPSQEKNIKEVIKSIQRGELQNALEGLAQPRTSKEKLLKTYLLLRFGKYNEVKKMINELKNHNEILHEVYYIEGLLNEAENNLKGAEKSFRNAIYIKMDCAKAHFALALLYRKLGKMREALRECKNTLKYIDKTDENDIEMGFIGMSKKDIIHLCEHFIGG